MPNIWAQHGRSVSSSTCIADNSADATPHRPFLWRWSRYPDVRGRHEVRPRSSVVVKLNCHQVRCTRCGWSVTAEVGLAAHVAKEKGVKLTNKTLFYTLLSTFQKNGTSLTAHRALRVPLFQIVERPSLLLASELHLHNATLHTAHSPRGYR